MKVGAPANIETEIAFRKVKDVDGERYDILFGQRINLTWPTNKTDVAVKPKRSCAS
jgi:hypothetical protein